MLEQNNCALLLVDVQGKLAQIVKDSEMLHQKIIQLIKGLQMLNIPIVWVEQNPDKLGSTSPEIAALLKNQHAIPKMTFSVMETEAVAQAIEATGKQQILLAGIESHICIYQTAKALKQLNYTVEIVTDAVSSRTESNHHLALKRLAMEGIPLTTVEMALYEILGSANHPNFKDLLQIIK